MALPDLQTIVMSVPGVVIGFAFHEFAHAWTADRFGDDTPRLMGRVTLNPAAHLDPIGTILLLVAQFGWAKPVQVNTSKLRPRVLGDIAVSLAGVTMNLLLAVLFYFLAVLAEYGKLGFTHEVLTQTLLRTAIMNLVLVAINILPVPPLDGFHVAKYLIPNPSLVQTLYRFGPMVLILLFMTNVADGIIGPVLNGLLDGVQFVLRPVLQALLL